MNHFKNVIKAHLDSRAATDPLFAKSYAKENKNIDECCNYIISEVKKAKREGFADEEIFNFAVHYYDEVDIKVGKVTNCKVVVNTPIEAKAQAAKTPTQASISQKKTKAPKAVLVEEFEKRQLTLF